MLSSTLQFAYQVFPPRVKTHIQTTAFFPQPTTKEPAAPKSKAKAKAKAKPEEPSPPPAIEPPKNGES